MDGGQEEDTTKGLPRVGVSPLTAVSAGGREWVRKHFSRNGAVARKKVTLPAQCLLFSVTVYFLLHNAPG